MIRKILKEENIHLNIESKNKEDIINILANSLERTGDLINKSIFINDIYERETQGLTGLENGLAIPHGKSFGVKNTSLAVARLNNPIEWETLDGEPVDLIVLFAVTLEDKNDVHIKILSKVAGNLAEDENVKNLKKVQTKDEIINILSKEW
ncbi:PTS sugar transporter subunit IIA [uncultured Cetobacterium sp.]|uniref:PTS sugar transporter subunit IIA n=1 Tax=uncultured Cetobacterium sp. TaxID=527638 RepID=UPI0025FB736F|nr:PTS sugar transporter subunit IIA [uncultured Cetobacterium sp.]